VTFYSVLSLLRHRKVKSSLHERDVHLTMTLKENIQKRCSLNIKLGGGLATQKNMRNVLHQTVGCSRAGPDHVM